MAPSVSGSTRAKKSLKLTFTKPKTARSDKNTNSCPKTFDKTVTGYIFYHTSKILQTNKKTRKINLFNAIPKTFEDVKFTVDGMHSKHLLLCLQKLLSNASCASKLKQFILMAPSVSGSSQCKEITEINIF